MLLYTCFRFFSEVMDQMFLTVRGAVQGSFTLRVASVFVHVVLRPGWGAWRCPPPPTHTHTTTTSVFFSSVLIYSTGPSHIRDTWYIRRSSKIRLRPRRIEFLIDA